MIGNGDMQVNDTLQLATSWRWTKIRTKPQLLYSKANYRPPLSPNIQPLRRA